MPSEVEKMPPFYGSDGMCDVEGVDPPDFPQNISAIAQPENAVVIIHKLVMSVRELKRKSELLLF